MKISAKELRSRVGHVLKTVERGESVVVTYRGKPRVRIEAIEPSGASARLKLVDAPLFGIWSDHQVTKDSQEFVDSMRKPRT